MDSILLLGAGKISAAIIEFLGASGDYDLSVAERDQALLDALHRHEIRRKQADVGEKEVLWGLMKGQDAVISALPRFFTNALNYNLTWSTDGLINESCNPCEAIHDGTRVDVLPLQSVEQFSLDGITYEAFNTSGGLGTLCETLDGKVRELNYKTVRYPGHCDYMKLLVNDLRLGGRRALFKDVLETAIPVTLQDVVLVFVTVTGQRDGRLTQESYANKIFSADIEGHTWSAIQITAAAGVCAAPDLMCDGKLPTAGFVRQENIDLKGFLTNRFGRSAARPGHRVRRRLKHGNPLALACLRIVF